MKEEDHSEEEKGKVHLSHNRKQKGHHRKLPTKDMGFSLHDHLNSKLRHARRQDEQIVDTHFAGKEANSDLKRLAKKTGGTKEKTGKETVDDASITTALEKVKHIAEGAKKTLDEVDGKIKKNIEEVKKAEEKAEEMKMEKVEKPLETVKESVIDAKRNTEEKTSHLIGAIKLNLGKLEDKIEESDEKLKKEKEKVGVEKTKQGIEKKIDNVVGEMKDVKKELKEKLGKRQK